MDISDPTNPTIAGSADTPSGTNGVHVSGNYAYVTGGGLQVVDISDPTNPKFVGADYTTGAYGVFVLGNYVYVANWVWNLNVLKAFEPCSNIAFVDSSNLTATVPAGMPVGTHNLHVVNPKGERAILLNSFTVTEVQEISVDINIYPRVLNLKSKGKKIISGISLPEEYDPRDIASDSIELSIPSCSYCEVIYPTFGFPLWKRYLAFFPRQELIDEIETMNIDLPTKLDIKITGELDDGTPCEGLGTIRVIKRKKWTKRR